MFTTWRRETDRGRPVLRPTTQLYSYTRCRVEYTIFDRRTPSIKSASTAADNTASEARCGFRVVFAGNVGA